MGGGADRPDWVAMAEMAANSGFYKARIARLVHAAAVHNSTCYYSSAVGCTWAGGSVYVGDSPGARVFVCVCVSCSCVSPSRCQPVAAAQSNDCEREGLGHRGVVVRVLWGTVSGIRLTCCRRSNSAVDSKVCLARIPPCRRRDNGHKALCPLSTDQPGCTRVPHFDAHFHRPSALPTWALKA
jgi:hypothetical protein